MIKKTGMIIFMLITGLLNGCTAQAEDPVPFTVPREGDGYKSISAEDARKLMDSLDVFILLDVRTEAEYNDTRIPGAVLIPDYEVAARVGEELPDKGMDIFIYCRSGRRSKDASGIMAELGYTRVWEIGGIIDWPYGTEP
jgi:rhodanese-related sulfurtransferase